MADALARERALIAAARLQAGSSRDRPERRPGVEGAAAGGAGAAGSARGACGDAAVRLGGELPGYQIEREIHRGGQGVVYLALQRATRRRVAIKVMKEGPFASADDRVRFEREVRILGQINHPSIVTIHDSGTAAGCFYIVMNYIEGLPLDAHMRSGERPCSLEETLRLFMGICEAVNAAHLRGVIHRDLKPSNIRVDSAGRPHVLDFGLAKVDGGSWGAGGATIMPAMTLTGQFVGSLPWSSPEQAAGGAGGVDVRSDVYSLGVVLYQMLTGTFPYEVGGSMLEVARRIAHAEPMPPSEAIAQSSRLRRLFGDRSSERIDDEVETIVLKCLSKDRQRRYQNAGELARDIGHYLAGEPIEAKRDSLAYVLGKQVKRHRLAVAFAATLALVVLAGFATSVALWQRAEREAADARAKGDLAEQRAEEARQIATFQQKMLSEIDPQRMGAHLREDVLAEARSAMQRSGAGAEQVGSRLEQVAAQLAGMNLTNVGVRSIDRNVLEPALLAVDRDFADQPLVQAALLESIAKVYLQLGQHEQALPAAERALETRRRLQGPEHPDTLTSIHATALVLYYSNRWPEAEALAREAHHGRSLSLGDDHVDTMRAANTILLIQFSQNKHEEAEQNSRELLERRRRVLGDEHPDTLESINGVAAVLWKMGRLSEVEPYWNELMEKRRRTLGDQNRDTLLSISNMGLLRNSQGRLTEAEGYYREALAGYQSLLGDDHMETSGRKRYLGSVLRRQGRLAEAEPYLLEALEWAVRVLGEEAGPTRAAELEMAQLRHAQGRLSEAEVLYRKGLEATRSALGEDDPATLAATQRLAALLRARGELAEAESLGAELVQRSRAALPPGHRSHGEYLTSHARTLVALGRFEDAEAELLEAEAVLAAAPGSTSQRRQAIAAIVHLYDAWHAAAPDAGHDISAGRWQLHLAPGDAGADAPTERPGGDQAGPQAWWPQEPDPRQAISVLAGWGGPGAVSASSDDTAAGLIGDLNFTNIGVRSLDRNIIEPALVAIERDFADQPLVQAALLQSVSRVCEQLGFRDEAAPLAWRAFEVRRSLLGASHVDVLSSLHDVASLEYRRGVPWEAERYRREVLDERRLVLGGDDRATLISLDETAKLLLREGRDAEAEVYIREVTDKRRRLLGDDHPDTLESITGMGVVLHALGRFSEAEVYSREAVEGRQRILGSDHPNTHNSLAGLGMVLISLGRLPEAEACRREAVEGRRRVQGDEHPDTLASISHLGELLRLRGEFAEAEAHLQEAMGGASRVLGPDHETTLRAMSRLALLRIAQGRLQEAEELSSEALRRSRTAGTDQAVGLALLQHAQALIASGRLQQAELEITEAMAIAPGIEMNMLAQRTITALASLYDTSHTAEPGAGHDASAAAWRARLAADVRANPTASP